MEKIKKAGIFIQIPEQVLLENAVLYICTAVFLLYFFICYSPFVLREEVSLSLLQFPPNYPLDNSICFLPKKHYQNELAFLTSRSVVHHKENFKCLLEVLTNCLLFRTCVKSSDSIELP